MFGCVGVVVVFGGLLGLKKIDGIFEVWGGLCSFWGGKDLLGVCVGFRGWMGGVCFGCLWVSV